METQTVGIVVRAGLAVANWVKAPFTYFVRKHRRGPIEVRSGEDERFCQERSEWSNNHHFTVVRRRIGLMNSSFSAIKVRVIVERIEERVHERALQVSNAAEGVVEVTVPPKTEQPIVFVDLTTSRTTSTPGFSSLRERTKT